MNHLVPGTSLTSENIIMNYTTCKENSLKYKNHFEQQTKSKTMRKNNHGFLMFAHMTHFCERGFIKLRQILSYW